MTDRRGTAATLAAASLVAGVLAYVLFAILTRQLGARGAAPVSVLWTYWGLSAAAISFPIQHWIAHEVAQHDDQGAVRSALPRLAAGALAGSAVIGLASWLAREPLFGRADAAFPALFAGLTATAFLMGILRGVLTARRQFRSLAASLVGEHVVRVVPVLVLAATDVDDPAAYGLVIVAGGLLPLLWPKALWPPRSRSAGVAGFASLGAAASAQLLAHLVLTSGPIVLALRGGAPAEVTALFTALAVFRAPVILAQGLVAPLTGRWTRLAADGRERDLARLRLLLLGAALGGAAAAAPVGAFLGAPVIRLVFGEGIGVERLVATLVAAGSALAVANIGMTVLAIAQGGARAALYAWLAGCAAAVVVNLLAFEPAVLTAGSFVTAEATAALVLFVALARVRLTPATSTP